MWHFLLLLHSSIVTDDLLEQSNFTFSKCRFFVGFFLVVVLNSNSYDDSGNVILNKVLIFLGKNILQPSYLCIPHIFS